LLFILIPAILDPMIAGPGRFLERALLFSFLMHGLGMLSMALLLLPGMPGGGTPDDLDRLRYISGHPWLWRLGWLPWQLTALSDLLIGIGLLRTPWIPKVPALLTALITVAAVLPDQAGQIAWMTRGLELAASGDTVAYFAYEAKIFEWTAVWGGTLYTAGALGWTWCFAAGGAWSRGLTALSTVLWSLFVYVNAGPLLPPSLRPSAGLVAGGNAAAFILLQLWFALVTEQVLRRTRPGTESGRWAPWRHPRRTLGLLLDPLANSRFVRALTELPPTLAFDSDITNVVYVNYLTEAAALKPLVPPGLELKRVGPAGRYAVFTFLTFRHGHFGPRLLGPLRTLLPSPIHTNWRIHVRDPKSGLEGIHFVTNAISSTIHALGARMMSEGMPMHVLAAAELRANDDALALRLDSGGGSAPDAEADLRELPEPPESGPWSAAFTSWKDMLACIVPQERALSTQPWHGRVTRQEIRLDIPLEDCRPQEGTVTSRTAAAWVKEAQPFCFRVEKVTFHFDSETYSPLA
jgi:hypothetical protein